MIFAINTILAIAIWLEFNVSFSSGEKKITIHILPIIVMILFNVLTFSS